MQKKYTLALAIISLNLIATASYAVEKAVASTPPTVLFLKSKGNTVAKLQAMEGTTISIRSDKKIPNTYYDQVKYQGNVVIQVKSPKSLPITIKSDGRLEAIQVSEKNSHEEILYIGAKQVDCNGVVPQKCLLTKKNLKDTWGYFYDEIGGFKYVPGYEYKVRVNIEAIPEPMADASSVNYTLIKILSKTIVPQTPQTAPIVAKPVL